MLMFDVACFSFLSKMKIHCVESEKDKTINSLRKIVEHLEKILIDMCNDSVKSGNVSEKSRSSVRKIKKKHKESEMRKYCREKENDKK